MIHMMNDFIYCRDIRIGRDFEKKYKEWKLVVNIHVNCTTPLLFIVD